MQAAGRRPGQADVWMLKRLRLLCGDRQVLQSTEHSSIDFQPESPAVRRLRAWMGSSRQASLPAQGVSAAEQPGVAASPGGLAAPAPQAAEPAAAPRAKRARQEDAVQARSVLAQHAPPHGRGPVTPQPSQQLSVPTQPWQVAAGSSAPRAQGTLPLAHASQAGPSSSQVRRPMICPSNARACPAREFAAVKTASWSEESGASPEPSESVCPAMQACNPADAGRQRAEQQLSQLVECGFEPSTAQRALLAAAADNLGGDCTVQRAVDLLTQQQGTVL